LCYDGAMAITRETVEYVAHLSRIELKEAELEKLSAQLKGILAFIDKLSELDISHAAPAHHILLLKDIFRGDLAKPPLSSEAALKNAPCREGNFYLVPKIIE